jgi:hypothetical protein
MRAGWKNAMPRLWHTSATSTASPELTEMDALIAYLQVLGTMVDFSTFQPDPKPVGGSHGYLYSFCANSPTAGRFLRCSVFFLGVVLWAFRPGSRKSMHEMSPIRSSATKTNPRLGDRLQGEGGVSHVRQASEESPAQVQETRPAIAGTASKSSTTRCRAGGSGPST